LKVVFSHNGDGFIPIKRESQYLNKYNFAGIKNISD
jgi:hypothetical protein